MSFSNIDKPSKYFNTLTYTGDASSPRTVTGVGFKPDFTWIKNRTRAGSSALNDNVRGVGTGVYRELSSETTNNEGNNGGSGYGYLSAFASDGFTLTTGSTAYDIVNRSGDSYVSWNWLADNTSGSSNTQGSITSTVSANTTSGFSIVSYTGTGTTAKTVGHGLGVAPAMIIIKNRSAVTDWRVYHKSLGVNGTYPNFLELDLTTASNAGDSGNFASVPTSSVFGVGNYNVVNGNGNSMIAYCFADVKGFSKFGSYTGNGSADGTFIYTGFKPAWVMVKCSSNPDEDWIIFDNKRNDFNGLTKRIMANLNNSEGTDSAEFDFVSNGFKCRYASSNRSNASGRTYIYMCFAENPFCSSKGIPTTAR